MSGPSTDKTRARQKVKYATKVGNIQRKPCQTCGDIPSEGHHPDYSPPLYVVWVCRACHSRIHAKMITHCPKGHSYDESNTYVTPGKPTRHCKQCVRVRAKEYQRKLQNKANALGISSRKLKAIAKAEGK